MNNSILRKLYEALSTQGICEDPFTSTEIEVRTEQLHDLLLDGEKRTEADECFTELIDLLRSKAFEAGFYTAVTLLTR